MIKKYSTYFEMETGNIIIQFDRDDEDNQDVIEHFRQYLNRDKAGGYEYVFTSLEKNGEYEKIVFK